MKKTEYLTPDRASTGLKAVIWIASILLALVGAFLLYNGIRLISAGDTFFYAAAGLGYLAAAVLNIRYRSGGAWLMLIIAAAAFIWGWFEVGTDYWGLFPRVLMPLGLAGIFLLLMAPFRLTGKRSLMRIFGVTCLIITALMFAGAFRSSPVMAPDPKAAFTAVEADNTPSNWFAYGRTNQGTRFAPLNQINRDNVKGLELAFNVDPGNPGKQDSEASDVGPDGPSIDQNTPLQLGNRLYYCSPHNQVTALEADTGKVAWTYSPHASSPHWQRCRGLAAWSEHDDLATVQPEKQRAAAPEDGSESASDRPADRTPLACRTRILMSTIDARLVALDADTGKPCSGFGQDGQVDLKVGMGDIIPGHYFQTSAPTVGRGKVIIGGWVQDNYQRQGPSGVIRAFDAKTGELAWAWDMAHPERTGLPPEGETYTRGTPNMWTTAAYDDKLGLVYIPLGNETPDYNNIDRQEISMEYNSSLVALDIETGRERWKFQTVHRDIWDYDLPSQPALIDVPDGSGSTVPAVMQTTKRGEIFLLNRETGKPIAEVREKPVPQKGAVPGDKLAPTQPYSVGMPHIGRRKLTPKNTWGTTLLDQLVCRVQFHELNYDGDFTPPGLDKTIQFSGNAGGLNWGSVSYDPVNKLAVVNDIIMPNIIRQMPRAEYEAKYQGKHVSDDGHSGISPQLGTPYALELASFWLSPIGAPCIEPPYGTITAIDMNQRKIAWQIPAGTAEELGPFGMKFHMPMTMGLPTYAGTMTTAGGLVFFAGFQDNHIRAFDLKTGDQLWEYELPWGSSATPMSYVSPKTGKQYIALVVGGSAKSEFKGTRLMAWALPDKALKPASSKAQH